jgi:hypothetical protein
MEAALAADTSLTPSERTLRGRLAAQTRWAHEDPTEQAQKGQAGLLRKFEREVDPDNRLDPAERTRRAESARKAHMSRLSFKSARARSERRNGARAH